jgi:CO/xanthine dehydrogenase FAD-binding subunit
MLSVNIYDTLAEAAGAMNTDTRYLGGGTLVMRAVNYGDQSFNRIVRARDPSMRLIHTEGNRIVVGAGTTMADIIRSPDLAFLSIAARSVGGPAIRNMATVGGNLFAPSPYGDLATALLALDATVRMADGREQPIEQFLAQRDAERGLVAAVAIARPGASDFKFAKVSRIKPKGLSVLSIAAWLPRQGGRISNVRIAFGAMGPTPLRAKAAEQALEGASLDEQGIAGALAAATNGLEPADDAIASAWYRREVAPVHLKRLLLSERAW